MSHVLFHADLDAFFASVEQRDFPELRGRPVVVGGAPEERGVVAAASYEARALGVHSAQPMRTALRLCPTAVRQPPRFQRYREVSTAVMAIFAAWTPLVEPLSLDEAFLDLSASFTDASVATLSAAGGRLQAEVHAATGLKLSVGIGTNKTVAKIASDLEKPAGLVVVPPGTEAAFLAPLPVRRLWGVGPRAEARLHAAGVQRIGEIAAADRGWLERSFGSWGLTLHELANGRDPRPVTPERALKQVSRETTFARDVSEAADLEHCLDDLVAAVARDLHRRELQGRTVTLKLRDSQFHTLTRQTTLATPTDDATLITHVAARLLAGELQPGRRFRLLGVGVSGFEQVQQLALPL